LIPGAGSPDLVASVALDVIEQLPGIAIEVEQDCIEIPAKHSRQRPRLLEATYQVYRPRLWFFTIPVLSNPEELFLIDDHPK
jgi:hypothetical protein